MERVRGTLITLCVLFCEHQRIFGTEVKIKVKAGDNVTLFGDCVMPLGFHVYWIRNESYGNQSSLLISVKDVFTGIFPHISFVLNSSSNSYDLHIENISVSDEGIYYCAKVKKKLSDVNGRLNRELEFQYGKRRIYLSLLEPVPSESPLPEVTELNCNCWMLLFSVCSVCVLLSSLLSAACVYGLCHAQTTGSRFDSEIFKANIVKVNSKETHVCEMSKTGKFCLHSEVTYKLLPSTHPYASNIH